MEMKIGLVLGSGAARGWAHIGIINGLAEMGIEPDIVSGSSIGALVGAAYAADKVDLLQAWACSLTWKEIIRFLDPTLLGGGLIQGDRLTDFISEYVKNLEFESLKRQLGVVATDLETGREIWFREGPVMEAVRASISLPGLFTPLRHEGRWLVDGGLANPVPVSLCRAMGADIVIAVNLNGDILGKHLRQNDMNDDKPAEVREDDLWGRITGQMMNSLYARKQELMSHLLGKNRNVPGLYEVLASSINIMQDRITRSRMAGDPPDVILTPRLSRLGLMEFDEAEMAIDEGLKEIRRMRPALEQLFNN
ncbi:MAG: patatin-like phospholipase RssA [Candidatus Thiodiazotropha sp. (ex Lucina aurantia)]|uniref:NTE family protein RssA n=2 Tax=Candidatus Thiodiazotropha TaxID=1913444 RepID=A0A7Z0VJ11_9GAMM|nr:patatin-like phospholipase RssA [Candidatus Thiodiazotropha endolucinida]MBT3013193.1 patatin-like phospholipase RssA [Candidatus Thiodiazotropha sp. (ex Lucina pensylvanica)]MBT3016746.1 patatin-like phospholipase RssA [Candidatus Thiodiazotropha taylori]MBT3044294.1 patatin-like phospholipase RssA [Candidatus Thiodiazotropha sp. (ex Codakia orbicularis)]MBV2104626.1 patatin-like phospholipase RssA [Candidatus Thiodiazotropha sp. (ex Lucina aurantia)]MBT3024785.1 patatin-like phospholipase